MSAYQLEELIKSFGVIFAGHQGGIAEMSDSGANGKSTQAVQRVVQALQTMLPLAACVGTRVGACARCP